MKKPPGQPPGKPIKIDPFIEHELSALTAFDESGPIPKNPKLLRRIVRGLVKRIALLNKKSAREATLRLRLLAQRERLILKMYGLTSAPADAHIGGILLLTHEAIKRELHGLVTGKIKADHWIHGVEVQHELAAQYIHEHPLRDDAETRKEAEKLFQDWKNEHLPILIPRLMKIPCLCDYLPASDSISFPDVSESGEGNRRFWYPTGGIIFELLVSIHHMQSRKSLEQSLKIFKQQRKQQAPPQSFLDWIHDIDISIKKTSPGPDQDRLKALHKALSKLASMPYPMIRVPQGIIDVLEQVNHAALRPPPFIPDRDRLNNALIDQLIKAINAELTEPSKRPTARPIRRP